jgi:hypothetical protein
LSHNKSFFALVIFQIGSCIYAKAGLGGDSPSYLLSLSVAGITGAYRHTQLLLIEMGVS